MTQSTHAEGWAHPCAELWCPASSVLFSAGGSFLLSSSSYSLTSFTSFTFSSFTTNITMNCTQQGRKTGNAKKSDGMSKNERLSGFEWNIWQNQCPHQEPVDVHEKQGEEKRIEEEVKGDVGDGLEAGHTCGIHDFEGEPVQTEPEPERDENGNTMYYISTRLQRLPDRIIIMLSRLQNASLWWRTNGEQAAEENKPMLNLSPSDAEADRAQVGQHVV